MLYEDEGGKGEGDPSFTPHQLYATVFFFNKIRLYFFIFNLSIAAD